MSISDWAIVLGALVLGFVIVSTFWGKKSGTQAAVSSAVSDREPAARAPSVVEPWNVVLGVAADAASSDVLDAYTSLLQQYDPEKTSTLAPELRELADHRSQRIVKAYEAFRAARGE